ncbi:hypothetical protein LINPERPRIM_LOCUS3415 [Linum perenne]
MARMMRSCVQSILKLVNSIVGMVGLGMVLYGVWLVRAWQRETGELPFADFDHFPEPWFIYTFLGLGASLCVITCFGHVSAEIANGCCLYLCVLNNRQYMMFMFLLIMLEAAVTMDVFLNRDWEKDFPKDPSGSFDRFKDFIRSHFEICKWVGLSIVAVQGLSFLFAMILKGLGHHPYYDSDDDFIPERAPLLRHPVYQPGYVVGNPILAPRTDTWGIRVNEKVRVFAYSILFMAILGSNCSLFKPPGQVGTNGFIRFRSRTVDWKKEEIMMLRLTEVKTMLQITPFCRSFVNTFLP